MKYFQLAAALLAIAMLMGCESTQTTDMGNQEQKRLAALQRQQAEDAQMDESDRNLWNAQVDTLYRGTNPAIKF
jgi:outer membrane murein-binding lipoprotein Lpp